MSGARFEFTRWHGPADAEPAMEEWFQMPPLASSMFEAGNEELMMCMGGSRCYKYVFKCIDKGCKVFSHKCKKQIDIVIRQVMDKVVRLDVTTQSGNALNVTVIGAMSNAFVCEMVVPANVTVKTMSKLIEDRLIDEHRITDQTKIKFNFQCNMACKLSGVVPIDGAPTGHAIKRRKIS